MEREKLIITSESPGQTLKIGEVVGKSLEPGSIIRLKGELGAGKTVFVKGLARGLGVEEEPCSPTFVILNCYEGSLPLYHFDLYRLSEADELSAIGYEEFFFGGGVTAVEWADRVPGVFPEDSLNVEITIPDGGTEGDESRGEAGSPREIIIEGTRKWVLSFKNTAAQASLI